MTNQPDLAGLDTPTRRFVAAFIHTWSLGHGADSFIDSFVADWVDPDVALDQPLTPTAHGIDGFQQFVRTVYTIAPDLRCTVTNVQQTHSGVDLDLHFYGTVAGRSTEWKGRDIITLRDGRLLHRRAELDTRPIAAAIARSPRTTVALLRANAPTRTGRTAVLAGLATVVVAVVVTVVAAYRRIRATGARR